MVLPTMQENGCQVFVTSLIDGKYTIDAHLENSVADMMLRYSQKGFYRQTELLCKKIDAENLLNEKNDNDWLRLSVFMRSCDLTKLKC